MTGRVQETGQEVYIKFIDYDINTAVYSKADLLKAVQHQLSSSRFTRQFQVVDFDKDARVTNRYGDLYIAGTDGSVNFGKDEVQQYLLSGHVILKKAEKEIDPEVVKPATDVAVHYNVNFESYEDGRKYNYSLDLDRKKINSAIDSEKLKTRAQEILNEKHPGFVIAERVSTRITHDGQRDTFFDEDNFTYYVKNREFILKEGDKTGYGTENGNTDAITETYTIVHKDQLANYGKEKTEPININYIDDTNGQLLLERNLLIHGLHDIDFTDGYDSNFKNRILVNNLDYYNIENYTITGRVDHFVLDGKRRVNVYMTKRTANMRPTDHYGYDNGYSEEEKQKYAYLREDEKQQLETIQENGASADKFLPSIPEK